MLSWQTCASQITAVALPSTIKASTASSLKLSQVFAFPSVHRYLGICCISMLSVAFGYEARHATASLKMSKPSDMWAVSFSFVWLREKSDILTKSGEKHDIWTFTSTSFSVFPLVRIWYSPKIQTFSQWIWAFLKLSSHDRSYEKKRNRTPAEDFKIRPVGRIKSSSTCDAEQQKLKTLNV